VKVNDAGGVPPASGPAAGARRVIAIDGPAGSGKSTVARAVAERLGLARLDTGAMYRAVTLLALRAGAELTDEEASAALARGMELRLGEAGGPGGGDDVILDREDASAAIRSPAVDASVSVVAAHPAVRRVLVDRQREWVEEHGGGVVEGRDIGSVVFPDARLKVYLTASPDERARRRIEQAAGRAPARIQGTSGAGSSGSSSGAFGGGEAIIGGLHRRDHLDSTRANSPLVVADGAVIVDSTGRTIDDVVKEVLSHL
jgi:cytidylate kinase